MHARSAGQASPSSTRPADEQPALHPGANRHRGRDRPAAAAQDYVAAAKGNTLLNDAGVKPDLLPYVCDAAPAKQGKYLPGSHISIRPPAALRDDPPNEMLILPWNIADEVKAQLADLTDCGTRFVTAVPMLRIC
ncbi:MAG: methyltransferase C-terminal domain-containing protein [Lamprobacter sp.]|uniref:methyltransferase C-terminal domain-containing protein n=1 Tax=Lamprobacter sp. TaxID=3100796 RepID=UPI002B26197D|nr:methyltransferase C-terminal domain-containing protein [Lamprobacter sp.]MEA3642379.1 methyltransferase C-terminal domain-containing protein [Lamprobacter sp.]